MANASSRWPLRRERLYALGGDSPLGLRLPLASLPDVLPADADVDHAVDPFAPAAGFDQQRHVEHPHRTGRCGGGLTLGLLADERVVGEAELLADGDPEHPEHQPDGEHQGEAEGGPDEDRGAALLEGFRRHGTGLNHTISFFTGFIKKSKILW